jgi:xanthine dehydrogenase iron-sulfur cluster and FAD-binding subunit A
MLLQNRAAFCDALITDMCRCAGYKPPDVIGLAAAKLTYSRSHRRAGIGNCFLKSQPTAFHR